MWLFMLEAGGSGCWSMVALAVAHLFDTDGQMNSQRQQQQQQQKHQQRMQRIDFENYSNFHNFLII